MGLVMGKPVFGKNGLRKMAEREGFEPSVGCYPHTRLAGEHHRPTRSSLRVRSRMAEGVGFEPTELSLNGFQDRRLKPLGHPSSGRESKYHFTGTMSIKMSSQKVKTTVICHCLFNKLQRKPASESQSAIQTILMTLQKINTPIIRRCDFNRLQGMLASGSQFFMRFC